MIKTKFREIRCIVYSETFENVTVYLAILVVVVSTVIAIFYSVVPKQVSECTDCAYVESVDDGSIVLSIGEDMYVLKGKTTYEALSDREGDFINVIVKEYEYRSGLNRKKIIGLSKEEE